MTLTDIPHVAPQSMTQDAPLVDPQAALKRAKYAYSTRFIHAMKDKSDFLVDTDKAQKPNAGDVVLARITEIGKHKRLEGHNSRRQTLFLGNTIVVSYGSRYAADQFLAVLPNDLGPCNLAAAGGLAAEVIEQHDRIDFATEIEPIGLLKRADGRRVNVRDYAPHTIDTASSNVLPADENAATVPVISVLGTSMNSGKSTTLACLARGLVQAGLRVHVGKATGTGAGNDTHLFTDAGAHRVLDFTDFGFSTTFGLSFTEVEKVFTSLATELSKDTGEGRPDIVLIEIADGIFQGETRELLTSTNFVNRVNKVLFSAGDALGAVGGTSILTELGHRPLAVSGVLTASPLAAREATAALDVPVLPTYDLCDPHVASSLLMNLDDLVFNDTK